MKEKLPNATASDIPNLTEIIEDGVMPSVEFSVCFDEIDMGKFKEHDISLNFRYDRHGQLDITHKSKGSFQAVSEAMDSQIFLNSNSLIEKIEVLGIRTSFTGGDEFSLQMTPKRSPSLFKLNENAVSVKAYLLNGPKLHDVENISTYTHNNYEISIRATEFLQKLKNKKAHKYDYVVSHELNLTNKNNTPIPADIAIIELCRLRDFFTFVRGGYCGIGHIQGIDFKGKQTYNYLGFNKSDQFQMEDGWFNFRATQYLPNLYTQYRKSLDDKQNTYVINRSIEFYRASNTISDSTKEVALVSSYASLETLIPHLLFTKAGWSSDLIKSKSKFADQLRAACSFIGLSTNLFEHLPELQKKMAGMDNHDEFDLLSVFRNRIVHQGKKFDYNGTELHEIWSFCQWLVEIFIFYMIGYKDEMNDRRKYTGWNSGLVPVPI